MAGHSVVPSARLPHCHDSESRGGPVLGRLAAPQGGGRIRGYREGERIVGSDELPTRDNVSLSRKDLAAGLLRAVLPAVVRER
jgi:hypothetical protein